MWSRIFCRRAEEPAPEAWLKSLHDLGLAVTAHFKGDDLGWTSCELLLGSGSPVVLARYLTTEDDLRHDLNTWAAELETMDFSPNHTALMERVIQSQQLITLRKPIDHADEVTLDRLCLETCLHMAKVCDAIYQIDGQGWFDASGNLQLQEY